MAPTRLPYGAKITAKKMKTTKNVSPKFSPSTAWSIPQNVPVRYSRSLFALASAGVVAHAASVARKTGLQSGVSANGEALAGASLRDVIIGFGGNLGEPARTFRAAAQRLSDIGRVVGGSRLYLGPAVGPPQPDYFNAALLIAECPMDPLRLVGALLEVERAFGRTRSTRWAPRPLDLDLLYAHGCVSADPRALLPHPRLAQRPFALRPLLELLPLACDPQTHLSYRSTLQRLGPDRLVVVGTNSWAN